MADGIRTQGTDDLERLAAALKEASDRDLTNRVRKSMRDIAKPVGVRTLAGGAERMPRRGGMASRVRDRGKVGVTSAIASRTVHVTLTLNNQGANLKALDAGILRHPVWARADQPRRWVRQSVPAKAFTAAFDVQAPVVRGQVLGAMQATLNEAARKV
jgi:hypothetical protein